MLDVNFEMGSQRDLEDERYDEYFDELDNPDYIE